MADCSLGRGKVEACIRALAKCVDISPDQLSFTWEELDSTAESGMGQPDHKVHIVTVSLGRLWSTLFFGESVIGNPDRLSERLFAHHKVDMLEALGRLRGLRMPIDESDCLDRWVADGDAFPGESA